MPQRLPHARRKSRKRPDSRPVPASHEEAVSRKETASFTYRRGDSRDSEQRNFRSAVSHTRREHGRKDAINGVRSEIRAAPDITTSLSQKIRPALRRTDAISFSLPAGPEVPALHSRQNGKTARAPHGRRSRRCRRPDKVRKDTRAPGPPVLSSPSAVRRFS